MRNSLYTVPEGFFDKVQENAEKGAGKIRKRRQIISACTGGFLTLVLVAGLGIRANHTYTYEMLADAMDQEIIEAYDCDIFLNILE